MSLWEILLIALALSMDAVAVSIASGGMIKDLKLRHALTIGAWFGFFQAFMPLMGWLAGMKVRDWIGGFDHWVAFGLLSVIGAKMVYEGMKIEEIEKKTNPLDLHIIFLLSVATSIDALAVGITFALQEIEVVLPVLIIGFVTFVLSFAGTIVGEKGKHFFEKKMEILGGIILVGIGLKILLSHIC